MKELHVLRTSKLIASAQAAIKDHRLGLQRGHAEPSFVYDDGSVCAIGAALPTDVLQAIRQNGDDRLNWLELKRAGYFEIDALDTIEALTTLQIGYDFCCVDDAKERTERTQKFIDFVLGLQPFADVWPSQKGWPLVI